MNNKANGIDFDLIDSMFIELNEKVEADSIEVCDASCMNSNTNCSSVNGSTQNSQGQGLDLGPW